MGDTRYLLAGDDHLDERSIGDGSVTARQSRGLRLAPNPRSQGVQVWIRQVRALSDTPAALLELDALAAERTLLTDLPAVRGLPVLAQFHRDDHTATLVYRWPTAKPAGPPGETLAVPVSPLDQLDAWRTYRLFAGLGKLCAALATLHDRGLAHRRLTPAGLIELDDRTLILRDLGSAAKEYQPGEGAGDYQAPEQSRRTSHRPGPWTDVYRLTALAYHLVTGHLPSLVNPLPLGHYRPELPERCRSAVDAALAADPALRPDVRALGEAFRTTGWPLA